jgi:hypothetical protein
MSFIKATFIRALRTAAQVAIGAIGAAAAFSDVRWDVVGGTVALAAILSVLTSIATGLPESNEPAPITGAVGDDAIGKEDRQQQHLLDGED